VTLDRRAAAVKSSRDVGRHRHETRLAEFGIPNAQHTAHEVDVSNRQPEHFARPQPRPRHQVLARGEKATPLLL
jgi:hypothetical protein